MSVTSGGTALKPLSSGGSCSSVAGSAGIDHLLDRPLVAVSVPSPDGRRQVLQTHDAIYETMRFGWVVRGPELEEKLVFVTEVDGLYVLALVQIPEMQAPAVLGAEQNFGNQSIFESVGSAPFAGDPSVVTEVPPGVVGKVRRSPIHLPLAAHFKRLVIHQENAARSLALAIAEGGDVDAVGPAMHGVGA